MALNASLCREQIAITGLICSYFPQFLLGFCVAPMYCEISRSESLLSALLLRREFCRLSNHHITSARVIRLHASLLLGKLLSRPFPHFLPHWLFSQLLFLQKLVAGNPRCDVTFRPLIWTPARADRKPKAAREQPSLATNSVWEARALWLVSVSGREFTKQHLLLAIKRTWETDDKIRDPDTA